MRIEKLCKLKLVMRILNKAKYGGIMITVDEVRKDLKSLKHLEYSIRVFERSCELLNKQYESYLKSGANSNDIEKLKKSIEKLNTSGLIAKSLEKKDKYFSAIGKIDEIDRIIIIDSVINGVTYWEIGRKLNYSVDAIKKRVGKALLSLVDILNGDIDKF